MNRKKDIELQRFMIRSGLSKSQAVEFLQQTDIPAESYTKCLLYTGRMPDIYERQFIRMCGLDMFLHISLTGVSLSTSKQNGKGAAQNIKTRN